ncbi:hypothetical protein [Foetidibacter luteolus]|uniref:hypothetical protein n=1 Tax=Foetidibacter luteolus TaxID=2608880 RepID=UPI00129BAFB0|nr:hypothetical protein [Foetidibacter luteolus]
MQYSAELLPEHKIDKCRWNTCVEAAAQQNIFMYSWALDALCDNWSGIVFNDYEAVMPVPWRKKAVLKYVYQVPFLPRISLMRTVARFEENGQVAGLLKKNFNFVHSDFDSLMFPPKWLLKQRVNYVLPLASSYDAIFRSRYTASCRKNIHKAVSRNCALAKKNNLTEVIALYDSAYGALQTTHSKRDYSAAETFAKAALERNMATLYSVENSVNAETLFASVILHEKQRLYYWLGAPSAAGRNARATYFFIDRLIYENAGKECTLDFEGSDIPSVASFYRQFGPDEERYFEVKKISLL